MSAIIISPIGILPMPVTIREDHNLSAEISENPIESGAVIADHAYSRPRKLSMEVAIDAPQAIWLLIKRLMQMRQPFIVVTGLDVYPNMLIKDVSSTRDSSNSHIFSGSIELQEVLIVETSRFVTDGQAASPNGGAAPGNSVSPEKSVKEPAIQSRTAATVHRGDSPTVEAPVAGSSVEAARNRSILSRVL